MFVPQLNAAGTAYLPQSWDNNFGPGGVLYALQRYASAEVGNAATSATIPAVAGQLAVITGFEVYAGGATAGSLVDVTITGILGGTQSYPLAVPTGPTTLLWPPLLITFDQPIPASGNNIAIAVNLPALGAGNTKAICYARGYYA